MTVTRITRGTDTTNFLGLPITSISELKKSPKKLFEESDAKKAEIFVFNRNKPEGVIISLNHYESMIKKNEDMKREMDKIKEELFDLQMDSEAEKRIKTHKKDGTSLINEKDVLGNLLDNVTLNDDDGWE